MERFLTLVFHVAFSGYCVGMIIWFSLSTDVKLVDPHLQPYVIASLLFLQGLHLLYFAKRA